MTPRPLIIKLARLIATLDRVPKTGRNSFHKYDYVTESDLLDAIRGRLGESGIMISPSVVSAHVHGEGRDQVTDVTMDVTLIDGESGDSLTTRWIGQGQDSADKGYYKAYTGAMKYFLLKTFMISTGDDPEAAPQRAQAQPQRPRVAQLADLTAAVLECGPSRAVEARWMRGVCAHYKVSAISELTGEQLAILIARVPADLARVTSALTAEAEA